LAQDSGLGKLRTLKKSNFGLESGSRIFQSTTLLFKVKQKQEKTPTRKGEREKTSSFFFSRL